MRHHNFTVLPGIFSEAGLRQMQSEMGRASNPSALCPDLLRYEQIGEADTFRGRVVRAFFWLLRTWPAGRR